MNVALVRCVDDVFPESMIESPLLIALLIHEIVEGPPLWWESQRSLCVDVKNIGD